MPRAQHVQLNVRSAFAKRRAQEIAERTGMTATQVVEEALRAYSPQGFEEAPAAGPPPGLVENELGFWVIASRGGPPITREEIDEAIDEIRNFDR